MQPVSKFRHQAINAVMMMLISLGSLRVIALMLYKSAIHHHALHLKSPGAVAGTDGATGAFAGKGGSQQFIAV